MSDSHARSGQIHEAVKNALIKDGWTITADPFTIVFEGIRVFADLAAERSVALQGERCIVVEVKSFVGRSPVHELEIALGQYILYRNLLKAAGIEYQIYLAVSDEVYKDVFDRKGVQYVVRQEQVRLLLVNLEEERIVSWKK